MDDLGNIVYVIIAIGWFFWNAYKKSQEKQANEQKQQRSQPTTSRTDESAADPYKSLEDIILEQLEGKREPKPEPVVARETRRSNKDKFLSMDLDHFHLPDDYQMSKDESKSHRVQRQVAQLQNMEMEPEASVMNELFPEGFDLRKAVVLNAILERPYR
ncbi:MAG: hypothetical protein H6603_00930 [Flavobacteriales bacterium]|nr:hypothetical protein [Flavobacteriales bacterium]MCB9203512.1 hypothetical protein [Flavobacteriales bacterium]